MLERRWCRRVRGGVAAPEGFTAAGVACGLKRSGELDLALLRCDPPATAAGLFTTNAVKAAPVLYDMEVLDSGRGVGAVVANSKVANACTGEAGARACRDMAARAREAIGGRGEALVLSTGIIGRQLPMDLIRAGIRSAAERLDRNGGPAAARAIMTTDTRPKSAAVRVRLPDGRAFTIGGMAKGAGMIHPEMATMLAVLTTDAPLAQEDLQECLRHAADRSFNAISVDGDTSTNDTVLLLSSRRAAAEPLARGSSGELAFRAALTRLCVGLARRIARDGEGARRLIEIRVEGAATDAAARAIGRVVATSPLVKTAFGAADPNWGRVAAAVGRSGEAIDPGALAITFRSRAGRVEVLRDGEPLDFQEDEASAILAEEAISMTIAVGAGSGRATVWTCDLSEDYVRINGSYRT